MRGASDMTWSPGLARWWGLLSNVHKAQRAFAIGLLIVGLLGPISRPAIAQSDGCPEPNDDLAAACTLAADTPVQAVIDRTDDVDAYRVDVAAAGRIQLDLTDLPADSASVNGTVVASAQHDAFTAGRMWIR